MAKKLPVFILCLTGFLLGRPVAASIVWACTTSSGAISCTGTAGTPEDVFLESFTLTSSETITVQTYGFGGGTNAAGATTLPGGFDSLVALFSGTPTAATVVTDVSGNPVASADALTLYDPGCPPAGLVTVGTVASAATTNSWRACQPEATRCCSLTRTLCRLP
jgi:hypothetical protein